MNALMPNFKIDNIKSRRLNMAALADTLKDADNINYLTPIDINSPDHIKHYFASGSYVREMILPAHTAVVGRIHKQETINILLEGEIVVVDETGTKKHLKAPHVFVAPAGNQKAAYTLTPVRWLNSFACETTDPDEAIELLTCETMEQYQLHVDSEDCKLLTLELCHTEYSMKKLIDSEDVDTSNCEGIYISNSSIHGVGVFASKDFNKGDYIALMRNGSKRTIAGRFTNHSIRPSSAAEIVGGLAMMICQRDINKGEEITVNYRHVLDIRREMGEKL